MKTTVSLYDFRREFEQCRPNNFSYEGLNVLFEYLEEYEDSTGEELELDVIALCCDFSEDTAEGIASNYSIDLTDGDCNDTLTDDEKTDIVREYLEDNGALIGETASGFVYRAF